ncbi:TPA: helix-turn-helix domain-containing protein [Streptococcus suis]|uniref:helix-turn-helix domain-containing protein n=1 Tax=Streptococcus suis TaxID=1307 RepID=UPI00209B8CDF|nr:S24 family peptidase [Streptococcus suis]MCO8207876.1 helix-turn-helix domain-containing protein [Streptococcus suis]MCO8212437.1 helix-turn-helix domain-containing protein [Streptococcus suis]HEM3492628.1 helix-turn-helix domain-containing protein [Streptococcus suis]HEM3494919.1 helix-turn-helix domain-containing protein [Streptococcus suis]HEM4385243.1 helix-turn-helix domain-containing protein [Streptococcus suis]
MPTLAENIKFYRKKARLTQKELASKLGIAPTAVSAWELGRNKPLMDNVESMALLFDIKKSVLLGEDLTVLSAPTTSPNSSVETMSDKVVCLDQSLLEPRHSEWISHGERLLEEQKQVSSTSDNVIDLYDTRKRVVGIVDFSASAGTGVWQDENLGMEVSFYEDDMADDYDSIGIVMGSSMEPVLKNGDYLFVKVTSDIPNGAISIWQVNGENFVKKFRKNKKPYLESLNPEFDDIDLHEDDDIRPLGIVVEVYREN